MSDLSNPVNEAEFPQVNSGPEGIDLAAAEVPNPNTPSDFPEQAPPPPHILIVISQLTKDHLDAAFQRIAQDMQAIIDRSGLRDSYNFLFLYDEQSSISERTSNAIYSAASGDFADRKKPNLLILHTKGGEPIPAYLTSRYLKTLEHGFIAVVPRRAKSAGTLIALGAKEIHMGMMSELGPIDPQFSNLPALGLGSALDYIAGVCEKHPKSAEMLAKYLQVNLNIHHLGLFERVSESATHYAQKLLTRNSLSMKRTTEIAKQLVYGYKDHSFAIDCDEIKGILGDEIVKTETPEYQLANQIHQYMEQVNLGYQVFHHRYCSIMGRADELKLSEWDDES